VLAANDRTASLVLTAAERHGVTVPDEAGIIGIDDDEMLCENMSPPLTSIRADFVLGGRLAGRLLADLVEGAARSGASLHYGEQRIVQRLSVRKLLRPAPSVRKVLETIRRRATEGISASDILPMLGGSRRSAEKRFRAATGKSILEEILEVRFEKLLPLLERGHLPLGTLAGLAGFSSENHLQRQFKSRYGMTPSAWRKSHLG
jgi:LacI family transcriptional regulator